MSHFSVGLWCVMKTGLIWQILVTSSVAGPRRGSKPLSKAKLAPKKCYGHFLVVWSIPAFWILVKPLYLRCMFNRWMRCTEKCNAYSQHQSTEKARFFSMTTPDHRTAKASKVEQIGLRSFVSSTIFTWLLTNWLPLLQASRQLFAGKNASTTSRRQKMLPKSSSNSWGMDFSTTGIKQPISDWQTCVDWNFD